MRILFLTSAHNSLSQRLWIELGELGHEICVCVAATDEAMIAAVSRENPDLIIAPMLATYRSRDIAKRRSDESFCAKSLATAGREEIRPLMNAADVAWCSSSRRAEP
jgi:hypothetical protein